MAIICFLHLRYEMFELDKVQAFAASLMKCNRYLLISEAPYLLNLKAILSTFLEKQYYIFVAVKNKRGIFKRMLPFFCMV